MDSFNSRLDDSLKRRARELGQLTTLLRSALPPESDGHYHVANIRDRTLVIITDSPVWTTRLRQLGPRILAELHNSGRKNLLHVRVFSRPARPAGATSPAPTPTAPRPLSPQSSRLIEQTAAAIEDDGLREALFKLAGHTRAKPGPENDQ